MGNVLISLLVSWRSLSSTSEKSTGTKIGTRLGFFSCSEVLACALLKLLPQYKDASIVRSSDKSVLDTCDIVVGVGEEYDPSRHRYDHNIGGFQESVSTIIRIPGYHWTTKLTSAGLIYCHFGHQILRNVLPDVSDNTVIDEMFKLIYDKLIKEIDAVCIDEHLYYCLKQLFLPDSHLPSTSLSARIRRLNSPLNSQQEKQFEEAVALAQKEFLEIVEFVKKDHLPSIDIVRRAVESRFEVDSSGEIIILSQWIQCMDYLFHLEKIMNVSPSIKYIIFGEEFEGDDCLIQCVPVELKSSTYRMLFPQAWGGLEDDALVEACEIEDALCVDPDRSMGFHRTKDGAVAMARKVLEIEKTVNEE